MTWHIHIASTYNWGHNQTPKLAFDMQRIACSSPFILFKNQKKLLKSWVVFAVNRYECFMENKNMLRIFSGCKPSKKNNIESHFTGCYKKYEGSGLTPKYREHQKVKR